MSTCLHCAHPLERHGSATLCGCMNCLNVTLFRDSEILPGQSEERNRLPPLPTPTPGSVLADVFNGLYATIRELPVPQEMPQRVISQIHDPLTDAADLAKTIGEDPVLAMRVLRAANSAFYGGLKEVTDLRTACARLGMKSVASLMWAAMGHDFYGRANGLFADRLAVLWRHALATAHAAETLAANVPIAHGESAFLAGLVHDVGKVVLLDLLNNRSTPAIDRVKQSPDAVSELLDRWHPLAGLHVVQYMQLPDEIRAPTYFHHALEQMPDGEEGLRCHLVAVADDLAAWLGFDEDEEGKEATDRTPLPSAEALGLDEVRMRPIMSGLSKSLDVFLSAL